MSESARPISVYTPATISDAIPALQARQARLIEVRITKRQLDKLTEITLEQIAALGYSEVNPGLRTGLRASGAT